ncbi:MAG: LptE family protein [Bacteroidota bacterium]
MRRLTNHTLRPTAVCAVLGLLLLSSACGIYNFQGGKLDPGLETVSVALFENNASIVLPTLAQDLTEQLKDRFISQSNLSLTDYEGDLQFTGLVTSYGVAPVAITGDETAAQNRLTITIKVDYECPKYPENAWSSTFSQFEDFPSSQNLGDVEETLVATIIERLTLDVFNKVLSNW